MVNFSGSLVMQNKIMSTSEEIEKKTEKFMVDLGEGLKTETIKKKITPDWTGETKRSTKLSYDFRKTVKYGRLTQNTSYIPEIYEYGGIIPSGTPYWVNKAAEVVYKRFGVMAIGTYKT